MNKNHKISLLMPWKFRIFLVFLAFLQPQVTLAAGAGSPICFSDVTIRPGSILDVPPTIDGRVKNDPGWLNSWRNVFHNGTTDNAVIQGIKDTSNIYLSFEVNNDTGLNGDDAIILTIDPNPASTTALRTYIRIYPVVPAGIANPMVIEWSQNTSGTGWVPVHMPVNSDPGANSRAVAAEVSGSLGNYSWSVELKLPMAVFGIPPAGEFAMYINVLPNKGGVVTQYSFPSNSPISGGEDLDTPTKSTWAVAKTNATSCSGVYIEGADIYTGNLPPHVIDTTPGSMNRFHAIVRNTSIDNSGNFIQANKVKATFSVAQFGIGTGGWKTIPTNGGTAPNNPTLPANIPGNSSHDFTSDWTLSAAERMDYQPPKHHQCILVDLESSKGACVGGSTPNGECNINTDCGSGVCQPTIFSVRSMYRNMDFAALSKYTSNPVINTRGWKAPPSGQNQLIELMVTKQIDTLNRDLLLQWISGEDRVNAGSSDVKPATGVSAQGNLKEFANWPAAHDKNFDEFVSQLAKPGVQVSQLTYLVHGCRHSGKFIKIHSNNYEICEDVGSFGYVLRHAGIGKARFDIAIDGPGLTKVKDVTERYQMSVAPEKSVQLAASFNAESVVTPPQPPCPCGTMGCPKQASIDTDAISGSLVLIGSLGIGGFAFLRRKRKKDENVIDELAED